MARHAELGRRLAKKLVRVVDTDGQEDWLLIHIEVQGDPDADLAERLFVYNCRIYDRHRCPVVSLAVSADERADWRPDHFGWQRWACEVGIRKGIQQGIQQECSLDFRIKDTVPEIRIMNSGLIHMQSAPSTDPVARAFAQRLRHRLGARVREVRLFGSRARGDAREGSDCDMLVVVDQRTPEIRSEILDIEVDLLDEYDVLVTSVLRSEAEWRASESYPFARNIAREGVAL